MGGSQRPPIFLRDGLSSMIAEDLRAAGSVEHDAGDATLAPRALPRDFCQFRLSSSDAQEPVT
jgi:hypothetical protein